MTKYPMNDDSNRFPNWFMTKQKKFFLYRNREEGIVPPHDVFISDVELTSENCEWYEDVEKFMEYEGVCTWADIGCGPGEPVNMGIGNTEDEARWHGLYHSIRLRCWNGGYDFMPGVYQVKSSIIDRFDIEGSTELAIQNIEEIEAHINMNLLGTPFNDPDGLWVAEVQPNKFRLYKDYGAAVKDLNIS